MRAVRTPGRVDRRMARLQCRQLITAVRSTQPTCEVHSVCAHHAAGSGTSTQAGLLVLVAALLLVKAAGADLPGDKPELQLNDLPGLQLNDKPGLGDKPSPPFTCTISFTQPSASHTQPQTPSPSFAPPQSTIAIAQPLPRSELQPGPAHTRRFIRPTARTALLKPGPGDKAQPEIKPLPEALAALFPNLANLLPKPDKAVKPDIIKNSPPSPAPPSPKPPSPSPAPPSPKPPSPSPSPSPAYPPSPAPPSPKPPSPSPAPPSPQPPSPRPPSPSPPAPACPPPPPPQFICPPPKPCKCVCQCKPVYCPAKVSLPLPGLAGLNPVTGDTQMSMIGVRAGDDVDMEVSEGEEVSEESSMLQEEVQPFSGPDEGMEAAGV
ncbi:hypothetical protein V8C86DRAFT_3146486 [Haematococcus lacustris]